MKIKKIFQAFSWRWNRFIFKKNRITYGHDFIAQGFWMLDITKNSKVKIGDNCFLNSGFNLNPLAPNRRGAISVSPYAVLIIGDNCGISSSTIWAQKSIIIGNNVNIGAGCVIFDSDEHSLNYLDRRNIDLDLKNKVDKPIKIGNDVLIGTGAIILKGVSIGDRSIIGAGSVVTKSIPSDVVAAGNPCRIIKSLV